MNTSLLEETFELVKSLNKTEKRYFNLYTKFQQGDKSYLKLFQLLDKTISYDEKQITQKFIAKNKTSNFPAIKKYLFDQLIASIKSYGAYKDLDSDHTDLIETYKVLHYKGLHGQSDRLLKKVKQLTLEDDAFSRHFSVLLMEYHKEFFSLDETTESKVLRILKERRNTLNIMDNYLSVGETFTLIRLHLRKKLYCRSKSDEEELTKIAAPLLKTREADMLSRTALGMRNVSLCDYYLAIGKPKKAFDTSRIYLELRKSAGSNDKLDLQTLNEHFQHITICIRGGFFRGFEEKLTEYKMILDTVRNKDKYFIAYEKWVNAALRYYNLTGRFKDGLMFLELEQKQQGDFQNNFSMRQKISFWYSVAYNFYGLGQTKKALLHIQRIINNTDSSLEEFIFAKLLMMYIHYDLENYELLEFQSRSIQRYMEKHDRDYQCEKIILDFFRYVKETDSKNLRQQQLNDLRQKVTRLFKSRYQTGFTYYFDILAWIDGQLRKH